MKITFVGIVVFLVAVQMCAAKENSAGTKRILKKHPLADLWRSSPPDSSGCVGVCQDSSQYSCGYQYQSGLCPGAANIKCCPFNGDPVNPTPPSQPTGGGSSLPGGSWNNGFATSYWDCCKPQCAWPNNVNGNRGVVQTCQQDGITPADPNSASICGGGGGGGLAYTCNNNSPFISNGQMYGFAASGIGGCCDCFELKFTSGPASGSSMIVQRTNTGSDVQSGQFDINLPGGGVGIYNGCTGSPANGPAQWPGDGSAWGQTYGGVGSGSDCANLPGPLQAGCAFRFSYLFGANSPSIQYRTLNSCPAELTSISGCSG